MPMPAAKVEKSEATIRSMFAGVASRYDLLNHLLSGFQDVLWRRTAARALELPEGSEVLDVCCGTGDQALALTRHGYRVTAADFCLPMLTRAQDKYARRRGGVPAGLAGDALRLPFVDHRFDGLTAAFGLRNVADLEAALGELSRVLRPGGVAAILEFALPRSALLRGPYLFYFRHMLPRIGALVSADGDAYSYLPASVVEFPQRRGFTDLLLSAGFASAESRDLSGGTVCLYLGRRAA
ncbi:MAG: ubiquinone/menaquinone biosynthesis methyltransferase [Thermoanaerobaculia bacterium]